jgi:hypothetical protein
LVPLVSAALAQVQVYVLPMVVLVAEAVVVSLSSE